MRGIRGTVSAVAAAAFLLSAGAGLAAADTIRISGTGGAIGTARILAKAFREVRPDADVVVLPSLGSNGAIRAVLDGRLEIALSSRVLTDEERDRGAVDVEYATTPFVFAVNEAAVVGGITRQEAAGIYAGKRTLWENGVRIRPVLRPPGESDLDTLRGMSPEMGAAVDRAMRREGMIVAQTDQDVGDAIEHTTGAFGATTLSLVVSENRRIRVLSLEGKSPTAGSYPYMKKFRMVTKGKPRGAAARFIDFVLSPAGASILSRNGQAPLRRGVSSP